MGKNNTRSFYQYKLVLLIVLILNLMIVGYFWYVLGENYTPVNDGWVSVTAYDHNLSMNKKFMSCLQPRGLRGIPHLLAINFEGDGFVTIRAFLATINIFTGIGMFLVLNRFFPKKTLFSIITSLLIMYFPYGDTMFWLGAFGVNLGYLLCIYSTYYFICSIEDSSNLKFWVAIFLLFLSGRTYPGYLIAQALVIFIFIFSKKKSWKTFWLKSLLFSITWGLGLLQFAYNVVSGNGREGKVTNFEWAEVLKGFGKAFKNLYINAPVELFKINPAQLDVAIFVIVLLVAAQLFIVAKLKSGEYDAVLVAKEYRKIILYLTALAPLILIAGYMPYSISDIRQGTSRQLLFARPGIVIFFTAILFFMVFSVFKNKTSPDVLVAILSSIIIGLSIQAKAKLANEYKIASEVDRVFLGDFALKIPAFKGNPFILIYLPNNNIILNNKLAMLLNRPKFPIRYLYKRRDLEVLTITPFYLKRFGANFDDEHFTARGIKMPIKKMVALTYSFERGFEKISYLEMKFKGKRENMTLHIPDNTLIDSKTKHTNRQKWFIDERNRLINNYQTSR